MKTRINSPAITLQVRDGLGAYRERWDELVDLQPVPTFSLKSWWLEAGVQNEPCFLLVFEGHELVGGMPFELETRRGIRRIKTMAESLWPVHIDLVSREGAESRVAAAITDWLQNQAPAIVQLKGLRPDSLLSTCLPSSRTSREQDLSYSTPLHGTLEGYLATKTGSFRRDLKRSMKRVNDGGYRAILTPTADFESALDSLGRLHHVQFGESSVLLPVFDKFKTAAITGRKSGSVEILQLVDESGEARVVEVWMVTGPRVAATFHGRDPDAPPGAGNALLAFGIEIFSERGIKEFDLGTHHGEWKERWAPVVTRCVSLEAPLGTRARGLMSLRDLSLRFRRSLDSMLHGSG